MHLHGLEHAGLAQELLVEFGEDGDELGGGVLLLGRDGHDFEGHFGEGGGDCAALFALEQVQERGGVGFPVSGDDHLLEDVVDFGF